MTVSAILAIAWVLAATLVALLPMRLQVLPGAALLVAGPALIGLLAWQHGALAGLAALAAVLSMFRNPIRYFWRKWTGTGSFPQSETRE